MSSTRDPKEPTAEEIKEQKFYGFEEDVSGIAVPDTLPLLPLRGVVIFPSAIVPLLISRGASQKNPEEEAPDPSGLYARGTAGRILKMLKYPDGSIRILVQGLRRLEVVEYTQREPYFRARVRLLQDQYQPATDLEAVQANMVNQFAKHIKAFDSYPGINLTQGNYALSQVWNGDARAGLLAVEDAGDDPSKYTWGLGAPKTELWMDNWTIVKGAKNLDAAYDFVNYILDPGNSAKEVEYHGYNTGVTGIQERTARWRSTTR
jgi:hypothetical protein